MSVLLTMVAVNTCVQILLEVFTAPATLVSIWAMMYSVQVYILMIISSVDAYISDINECSQGISGCSQQCINSIGSYKCDCNTGYYLSSNNHTCLGNQLLHDAFVYFVHYRYWWMFDS